ncbi:hypothetical protein ACIP88_17315 [Streptomyces uncialis]|uniref:hypothetical protein n=1 Tax=Streptomyces uncialis TaxID=1048205 RepID=UPI003828CBA7
MARPATGFVGPSFGHAASTSGRVDITADTADVAVSTGGRVDITPETADVTLTGADEDLPRAAEAGNRGVVTGGPGDVVFIVRGGDGGSGFNPAGQFRPRLRRAARDAQTIVRRPGPRRRIRRCRSHEDLRRGIVEVPRTSPLAGIGDFSELKRAMDNPSTVFEL